MSNNMLFYVVFLSQIFVLSYYYPKRILGRMRLVLEKFPATEYPKLYASSAEDHQQQQRKFKFINDMIFLTGVILILVLVLTESPANRMMVVFYFFLQNVPMWWLEISEYKYLKIMRKKNAKTTRKATLRPRKLRDFVSPYIIASAIFMYLACIFLVVYLEDIHPPWHSAYGNIVANTYANLFLLAIVLWKMYGLKQNPLATNKDRLTEIKMVANIMFILSILMSAYIFVSVILNEFEHLQSLEIVILSFYLQIVTAISLGTALRSIQIDNIDFDVYKKDPVT